MHATAVERITPQSKEAARNAIPIYGSSRVGWAGEKSSKIWRPTRSLHAGLLKATQASVTNCITLTIFNLSSPCRIREEKSRRDCCPKNRR